MIKTRIVDGRGTGKTRKLIEVAAKNHGVIVCSNPRAMEAKAHAYGIVGADFMSYEDYFFSLERIEGAKYYIDEIDKAMAHYDSQIDGYTLSLE